MTVEPLSDPLEGRLERLKARFADYASPVPEAIAELRSPDQVHFSSIEEVLQRPWARGKVLLIGDAAHATSPNMASGAAMAFEDALVLSELIGVCGTVEQLIDEYTRRRSARIQWVREQTHRRDRIRSLTPAVRDLLTRKLAGKVYRANYRPLLAEA